jgi:hypothetical protein
MSRYEIMFQCILKSYLIKSKENSRIYNLSRLNVGKKFKIVIGNERVLSSDVVNFILKQNDNNNNTDDNVKNDYKYLTELELSSPEKFQDYFKSQIKSQIKESVSKNYLKCACFVKIIKDCLKNND